MRKNQPPSYKRKANARNRYIATKRDEHYRRKRRKLNSCDVDAILNTINPDEWVPIDKSISVIECETDIYERKENKP